MTGDAVELAAKRKGNAGESIEYADARRALLAEEIELQRKIDAVAEQRRNLPPGPEVKKNYRFIDMNGDAVGIGDLFGEHDTLVIYFWMYGPQRERPCPMCTNLLGPLDANAVDIEQRVALAVFGRSKVERQVAFAQERDCTISSSTSWSVTILPSTMADSIPKRARNIR